MLVMSCPGRRPDSDFPIGTERTQDRKSKTGARDRHGILLELFDLPGLFPLPSRSRARAPPPSRAADNRPTSPYLTL